ncbi:DNA polymerase epsilon subunit B [Trypanosoma theileri]|uniref:DNA polymerase II subunit 2 n=1 Tax=Trypanosoma theileri TaxID=67003 RepID=A0A1X0P6P7_9TRYP|nr:DNA polymerase epsilon subunit B [Trypanosoma theileri]ORC92313.1 DNA polymerase epsilon subunit B [Trypanosoma theileri]
MQDYRAEIQLLARAHQYRLHPFALKELSDYVAGLGIDDERRRETLRELFALFHKLCLTDRFIDKEKMLSAIAQQSAKDRRTSEKGAPSVIPILLDEIPRVYMDERSGEMKVLSSKDPEGNRFGALRQRYLFARRRCLRSGLFRRDLTKQSLDGDLPPLLPSIALEGIDPSENVAVLGMIIRRLNEIHLEDLYGCLKLFLREDIQPPLGIVGDGFLVIVKGQWCNGRLTVNSIDLPPAERRENTLRDIGSNYDLFGHSPADLTAAFMQEKSSLQSVIIVMSHIYLDQQSTIEKLIIFFREMQNRTESELADTTLVMVGDFSSTPLHYEDVSHLPEPFEGSDRYKLLLDTLATIITTHAPGVAQHTQVILVPGPNDVTGLLGVLPQPPIVSVFGKTLQTRLKRVVFAPNPCRLRFFTHEIIVSRRDFFRSLQESTRGFDWSSSEEARHVTSFEKVAKTIVDEAHLAPEVKESILWKVDGALCMPTLPHLLVLCDSTEQWECTYKGVRIVNPGSFSLAATFLWYTPADGECSLSSVEQ